MEITANLLHIHNDFHIPDKSPNNYLKKKTGRQHSSLVSIYIFADIAKKQTFK